MKCVNCTVVVPYAYVNIEPFGIYYSQYILAAMHLITYYDPSDMLSTFVYVGFLSYLDLHVTTATSKYTDFIYTCF